MTDHDHLARNAGVEDGRKPKFWNTPAGFALCAFLAVAGVLIWIEHRAHVLGALPLLLPLVICVGMHFFMHRNHASRHGRGRDDR
jgi:hypothetical protein